MNTTSSPSPAADATPEYLADFAALATTLESLAHTLGTVVLFAFFAGFLLVATKVYRAATR